MIKNCKKNSIIILTFFLLTVINLNYVVKAENLNVAPKINFAVQANYPLYVGDKQTVYVNSNYEGLVQYRAFLKEADGTWLEVTDGYSEPIDGKAAFKIESNKEYKAGDNYFVVWVKRANVKDEVITYHDEIIKETEIPQLGGQKKIYDDVSFFKMTAVDEEQKTDIDEVDIKVDGLNVSVEGSDYYAIQALNVDASWEEKVEFTKNNFNREFKPGRYLIDLWADKDGNGYPDAYRLEYFELQEKEEEIEVFTTEFNNMSIGGETVITLTEAGKEIYPEAIKYSVEAYLNDNLVKLTATSLLNEATFTLGGQSELDVIVNLYTENDILIVSIPVKLGENGAVAQLDNEEIVEDDFIYGTEEVEIINKNVYIKGNNVLLKNLNILGKLVIDPGEKGITTLQNINVKNIEVLSGDVNSIHFNNVKANNLSINSESNVRVVVNEDTKLGSTSISSSAILENKKGNFGNVYIKKGDKKVIELKGNFEENIEVKGEAEIVADKLSKISNIKISPEDNTSIKLRGDFENVEVLTMANLVLEEARIETIIAESDFTLEVDQDSQIEVLESGENNVEVSGNEENIKEISKDEDEEDEIKLDEETKPVVSSKYITRVKILNTNDLSLAVDKTIILNAKAYYSDGSTNTNLKWTSSDDSIAEVNDGVVLGKKEGTVTITASKGGKSDTCIVNVVTVLEEEDYEIIIDGNDIQIIVYNTLSKKVSISLFDRETDNLKFYDIKPDEQKYKETYKVSTYLENGEYYGNIYVDGNSYNISSFKVE